MKDETGHKYGRLTVIKRGPNDNQGNARWYCKCDCNNPNLCLVRGYELRNGHTKSCGCLHTETASQLGISNRKINEYDLTKEFGIGYTSKGEPFYFDLEDYNLIKDYCWHLNKDGYVVCKRDKMIAMHRLVMHAQDNEIVDHIYHNTADNRKQYLRICTPQQNSWNINISHSSSGVRGVYWYNKLNKWSAEIGYNNTKINLGFFDSLEEAKRVRRQAELELYREYSYKKEGDKGVYNTD